VRRGRRGWALGGVAALAVALTGCVPFGFACSAVGYGSAALVDLEQPRAGLTLELCDGEGCLPGGVEQPVEIGATEAPAETGVFGIQGDSVSGWSVSMSYPSETLCYRVTDAAGAVVAEGEATVEWVRIDGSERCGGNTEARLTIPG
jgi:hypothetical protein